MRLDNNIKALLIDNDVLNRFSLGGVRINRAPLLVVVYVCKLNGHTGHSVTDSQSEAVQCGIQQRNVMQCCMRPVAIGRIEIITES